MRKTVILLLLIIYTLCFQACGLPSGHSIEDIQNILVVGLDTDGDNIVLTIIVDTMQVGAEKGEERFGTQIYQSTGQTVFEAKRALHQFAEKHIAWDYLKFIIIGENAAKQGVDRLLAFFCENEENDFTHALLISKGISAESFIYQTNTKDTSLFEILDALSEELSHTGKSSIITLLDYAISRERPQTDLYIPTVLLKDSFPVIGNKEQNKIVNFLGYALFDSDKLAEYLSGNSARGLNYVLNEIKSAEVTIKDRKNQNVSLEVIYSHADIEPDFEKLSAEIKVVVQSNLVEYLETKDIFKQDEYMHDLTQKQSIRIKENIEEMIRVAQKYKVDVFGLGNAFYHDNPKEWQEIKDNWKNIFPTIPIKVEVTSAIQCPYNLFNAIGQ